MNYSDHGGEEDISNQLLILRSAVNMEYCGTNLVLSPSAYYFCVSVFGFQVSL